MIVVISLHLIIFWKIMTVPYIVSCDWLHKKVLENNMKNIVIVDVSWASTRDCQKEYDRCHIPGAVYLNTICGENTALHPRAIPSREKFESIAQEAGINTDSHVIVYSSSDRCAYFISGRGWWSFKYFGHENVSILDGGLPKWQQLGYPTTDKPTQIQKGNFKVNIADNVFLGYETLLKKSSEYQVVDNRPYNAYSGQESPGHIPGAKSLTMAKLVNIDTGLLRTVGEMKQIFLDSGIDLMKPLATYCNSGMSSCTVAMAARMCGAEDATVFMGGFTEWKTRNPDNVEKIVQK